MSASLPNGSIVSIASTYGAVKAMSAITNAVQAVATLAASHGIVAGDIMEMTSGWERLDARIIRALSVATNDVTCELLDTTSTSIYPALGGVGSVREITAFTQIPQILESSKNGGEQQFVEFQYLSSKVQKRLPTVKSAQGLTFKLADDPSLAIYPILKAADGDGLQRCVLVTLPSGAKIYYNGIVSFNDNPSLDTNQISTVDVTISFVADLTRYTS